MIIPASNPDPAEREGKHRLRGVRMPGFGRILGTRDEHTVENILARHGRQVVDEDEAGAR